MERIFKLLRDFDIEMEVKKSPDPGDQGLLVTFSKQVNDIREVCSSQVVYPYGRYLNSDVEYALKRFIKEITLE